MDRIARILASVLTFTVIFAPTWIFLLLWWHVYPTSPIDTTLRGIPDSPLVGLQFICCMLLIPALIAIWTNEHTFKKRLRNG